MFQANARNVKHTIHFCKHRIADEINLKFYIKVFVLFKIVYFDQDMYRADQ